MVDEAISCAAAAALGYPSVRREQIDAVRAIASGNDVFVALPTPNGIWKVALLRHATVGF